MYQSVENIEEIARIACLARATIVQNIIIRHKQAMYKYKQSLELNCVLEVGIVVKCIHIASQHLMAVGKLVLCV